MPMRIEITLAKQQANEIWGTLLSSRINVQILEL